MKIRVFGEPIEPHINLKTNNLFGISISNASCLLKWFLAGACEAGTEEGATDADTDEEGAADAEAEEGTAAADAGEDEGNYASGSTG
jgi:hypothetical protein